MFLTQVERAESRLVILALKQWGLVSLQDFRAGRAECELLGPGTQTPSEMLPAAQTGEILGVGQTDIQREVTLGSVDEGRVCQTNLHLQIIPGFVSQTVGRVLAPGPAIRVLYGVGGVLRLEVHQHRAAPHTTAQNKQRQLEISNND